jgi:hypothetical protein
MVEGAILSEAAARRVAILGLHHGERGTILHVLVSGVTLEDEWAYVRGPGPAGAVG